MCYHLWTELIIFYFFLFFVACVHTDVYRRAKAFLILNLCIILFVSITNSVVIVLSFPPFSSPSARPYHQSEGIEETFPFFPCLFFLLLFFAFFSHFSFLPFSSFASSLPIIPHEVMFKNYEVRVRANAMEEKKKTKKTFEGMYVFSHFRE